MNKNADKNIREIGDVRSNIKVMGVPDRERMGMVDFKNVILRIFQSDKSQQIIDLRSTSNPKHDKNSKSHDKSTKTQK